MKNYYIGLALAAMAFSACSQKEDITSPLVGKPINATFSVGGAQTRVNTLDEQANEWENGDMIKAVVNGGGKTTESVLTATVSVSEDGRSTTSWSHHKNFVWQDNGNHKVYVLYPSDYPCDENGKWTLPTDQSALEKLKSADFIDGKYEGVPRDPVQIQAGHRLALVTVTYEIGTADFEEGTILGNPVVWSPSSKFSGTGDGVSGVTGSGVSVKAYVHEGSNKFSAIIVPGTINVDSEFLSFSVGEKKYVSKLKREMETDFKGGHCYTYNLKIGKDKVELTQIKVESGLPGWGAEEELK